MHETDSFVYSQDDLLGQGATSDVYKAISKKNGSFCALKVFKKGRDSAWKLIKREMDVLSKIKHENIVQIFGMEINHGTGQPILIMEYLSRGTLYDQLREPKNVYGFCDHMYLFLLKDIAAGLTQLHMAGIVHRDIKPNNILRSIMRDGREIYKLSDFGTAKTVSNQDAMESLVGTEEYVHPAMYEKVFINKEVEVTSPKHLDRWSLGITLYHVAAGKVPFQTKGGLRTNRKCRLDMFKLKPHGAISARETENSEIIWETELPATCILSSSFSKLIVNSIRHLLETNPLKAWNIQDFLLDTEKILKKIPVHIMQPSQDRMEIFYLNPDDKIPHLKEAIAQEWDVLGHEQLLFHGCIDLTLPFEASKRISEYPPTRTKNPVILIEKDSIKDVKIPSLMIERISFPKEISPKDSTTAQHVCADIYRMVRVFRHHCHVNDCMLYAVGILNSMVGSEIRNTQQLLSQFRNIVLKKESKSSLDCVNSFEDFAGYPNIGTEYKQMKNLFKEAGVILNRIQSKKLFTANIYHNVTDRNQLETISKTAQDNLRKHEKAFSKVRGDFQKWQSKKLEALQSISNLKKQLLKDASFQTKHGNTAREKKFRSTAKELIERSKTELTRLSDLNTEMNQLVSSGMSYS